jgi:hypothetical protein
MYKIGATMEDQMGTAEGALSLARIRDAWNASGTLVLKLVPRRALKDYLPASRVPTLDKILRAYDRKDGRQNELQTEYDEVARSWARLASKDKREASRVSEIMHSATLVGQDPSKSYAPLKPPAEMTPEDRAVDAIRREQYVLLKDYYDNAITDESRQVFKDVRDSYSTMRSRLQEALIRRIAESEADGAIKKALTDKLRMEFERGRVRGPYFPLMRYGKYWAVARDPKTDEVVAYSRFENMTDMKTWKKEFSKSGYVTDNGSHMNQLRGSDFDRIDPAFATKIATLARSSGDDTLADQIWQTYLETLPEMSVRKQMQHRKGRLGFAADGLRAFASLSSRYASQQANLEYMHKIERDFRTLEKEVKALQSDDEARGEFPWAAELYKEMKARHLAMQNPTVSAWAVRTTNYGFLWFLGFTPAAAAVNLTQTAIVGIPTLSAEFSNKFGALSEVVVVKELTKALKSFASTRGPTETTLRGDEYRAMVEARSMGVFEKTQAHDLTGLAEAGIEGTYGGFEHKATEVGAYLFHKAEQLNREVTFLAAYRLARKRGDDHDSAVMLAEDLTWDTHFNYNLSNKPIWMQGNWGRVITLFKNYSLNMTYRLARDFRDGVLRNQSIPKEARTRALRRFTGMIGMTYLMAGYTGLPTLMTMPVSLIMEAIFDDEDDPYDFDTEMWKSLSEWMGPEAAHWVMKGAVDGGLGLTLSDRVSLGNLWWRDPGYNETGREKWQHIFMELMGPVPSTAIEITTNLEGVVSGEELRRQRAIEAMVPKAVKDVLRTYRYATEGALTRHVPADVLLEKEDFNVLELTYQLVGFVPAELSRQYDQNAAINRAKDALQKRHDSLINRYMLAQFENDKKEMAEAMTAIGEWNQANPYHTISFETLERSRMNRLRRSALNRNGVSLPPKWYWLHEELNFTGKGAPATEEQEP